MLDKTQIDNILATIGKSITQETTIYLIGGCAMSLKGFKAETLDVDMVLLTESSYTRVKEALLKLGYKIDKKSQYTETVYKNAFVLFKKGRNKVDIFITRICNLFDFSTDMMNRARLFERYNKLNVRLASNEDIFLFKSITGREKDLSDLALLATHISNWNVIVEELKDQKVRRIVTEDILESINKIEALDVIVPIKDKIQLLEGK